MSISKQFAKKWEKFAEGMQKGLATAVCVPRNSEHDVPTKADADHYDRILCFDARKHLWIFAPIGNVIDQPNRYPYWLNMPEDPIKAEEELWKSNDLKN